jgi:hypothetical protein
MDQPGLFGGQWQTFLDPGDLDSTGVDDSGAAPDNATAVPAPVSGDGTSAAQPSSVWDDLLHAGEAIWTAPNTALGVVAGMAGIPFGAKPTFEHGAIAFNDYPWKFNGGGALTLGNSILSNFPQLTPNPAYTYEAQATPNGLPLPPNPYVDVGKHEEGHVHQAGALGPLYLPTYVLQSIFSDGPSPMEKAADTYGQTGKGWWPW